MRILFTGASSFTGFWFVRALVAAGHEVTAIVRNPLEKYQDTRLERLKILNSECNLCFNIDYGSDTFIQLIEANAFDLFCHHAADVTNYKSPDFDPVKALNNNSGPLPKILEKLKKTGCTRLLLTGSVFEQGEGSGSDDLRAVSPYGLSKGLTSALFKYYAAVAGFSLGKFVIPNPFGPYEEPRFTTYLAKNWLEGKTVNVSMPDYVRDNVPVSLLAKAYVRFAEELVREKRYKQFNPSCYVGSQGTFTELFAKEMRTRIKQPCLFTVSQQIDFSEPLERVNTNPLDQKGLHWDESQSWDELADYYLTKFSPVAVS